MPFANSLLKSKLFLTKKLTAFAYTSFIMVRNSLEKAWFCRLSVILGRHKNRRVGKNTF
jgi:hypothetical protein